LIIVMYLVVIAIDQISLRVRSQFIEEHEQIRRPKWRGVFVPWVESSDD